MSEEIRKVLPWSWNRSPEWQGCLKRINRWQQRIQIASSAFDKEDFLYALFIDSHQLREWLIAGGFDKHTVNELYKNEMPLRLCRDIANIIKHRSLTRHPSTGAEPSLAREFSETGWYERNANLIVITREKKYDLLATANEVVGILNTFCKNSEPQ